VKCQGGFCEGEAPVVGGGEIQVSAAARAEGVDAVVDVRVEGGGTCKDSTCTVKQGATVTFIAPLVAGFRFSGWSGDALCVGSERTLVLRNVDDDVMCIANYVRRLFVRGDVEGDSGVVGADSSAPLSSCSGAQCEVDGGAVVVLTAPERAGFRFSGWSGEGCDAVSGVQVTITTDKSDVVCTAQYVLGFVIRGRSEGAEAVVTVTSSAATAVCGTSSCQVDAGSPVSLTAPVVAGFRFTGFSGAAACVSSEPAITIPSADADVECVASYVRRFRVGGVAAGASPLPVLQASSLDTFGRCEGPACVVDQGGSATLLAPTVSGFRLRTWLGADCAGQTSSSVIFEQVDRDIECSAEYVRGVGVNGTAVGANAVVSASSNSPGAVCTGSSCALDMGGTVTLNVASVAGYTFTGWTGDPGCQSSELAFTLSNIDGSKTCVANFSRVRFTVRVGVTPTNGGVIGSQSNSSTAACSGSGCTVDYGSNVTLTATPSTGYEFVRWSGCSAEPTTGIALNNVTADASCTATFALRQITVTTAVAPPGAGSVATPCGAAACDAPYGSTMRITALESNPGYRFSSWSGCSVQMGAALDVMGITSPPTCTANFVPRTYLVTASVGTGSGSVAPCGAGSCAVAHGSNVTLIAMPSAGYVLRSWTGDCSGSGTSFPLDNITGARTCVANFGLLTYPLTVSALPASGGTIAVPCNGASRCTVQADHGSQPAITATAAAGYVFRSWSGCVSSAAPSATVPAMTGQQSCVANFAHRVTAVVAPGGVASVPACGANSPCIVNHGAAITLANPTATNVDYEFRGWENCTGVATNFGFEISNITTNLTCTARFARRQFRVTASLAPDGSQRLGTVSPCSASSCVVDSGDTITLTATRNPQQNGVFSGWSCSASTSATLLLTVRGNLDCVASFVSGRPDLTATVAVGAGTPAWIRRQYRYPIRVTITNGGNWPVGQPTRVEVRLLNAATGGPQILDFSVPDQPNSPRFPYAPAPIESGASVVLDGTILLAGNPNGPISYQVRAVADSCAEQTDPAPPSYCVVSEANETNNTSAALTIPVPIMPAVTGVSVPPGSIGSVGPLAP